MSPGIYFRYLISVKSREAILPEHRGANRPTPSRANQQGPNMTANFAKPILGSSLPHGFRRIRLELAREPDHPEGDSRVSYVLIAPLDATSQIDLETWKHYREASRVVRQRPGEPDASGHLIRSRSGGWAFHYDSHGSQADETGYRFADEHFSVGEYVSIKETDGTHVYRVASIERL